MDAETGLYYYRARYYDPAIGRFISADPIGFAGGDANLYRYVGNSPVNWTDPSGNIAAAAALAGPAGIAIVAGLGAIYLGYELSRHIDLSRFVDLSDDLGPLDLPFPENPLPDDIWNPAPEPIGDVCTPSIDGFGEGIGIDRDLTRPQPFPVGQEGAIEDFVFEASNSLDGEFLHPSPQDLLTRPNQIARRTGHSTREINDAIHRVKNEPTVRANVGRRNPDVGVDIETGDVFVEIEGGVFSGDPIGNIFDYLPE